MAKKKDHNLTIVTGLAGAGMSSVLKTLEDLGYEVFDNFPLSLVEALLRDKKGGNAPIVIGIDTRSRGFSDKNLLKTIKDFKARLVFVTCDDNILQRRFKETRRKHPLAAGKTVASGIAKERALLEDVQGKADLSIDTTHLSVHDLRHILEGHFALRDDTRLSVTLMSFGFSHGTPREADIILDVRFLKNPHWDKKLRPKTGKQTEIGEYIQKDPDFDKFFNGLTHLLEILLPRYAAEGKIYLTIALGCTGGRHRSVFIVEKLQKWVKAKGYETHIEHRDLKR